MSKSDVDMAVEAINEYFRFKIDFFQNQKKECQDEKDMNGAEDAQEKIDVFDEDWKEVINLISEKTGYKYDKEEYIEESDNFMEMLKKEIFEEETEETHHPEVKKSFFEKYDDLKEERERQRQIEREELRKERMRIRERKWEEKRRNRMSAKQTLLLTGISAASAFAIGRKIGKSIM